MHRPPSPGSHGKRRLTGLANRSPVTRRAVPAGLASRAGRPAARKRRTPRSGAASTASQERGSFAIRRFASCHKCRVDCGLRSAGRRGHRPMLSGGQRPGHASARQPWPARKLAGFAQFAQARRGHHKRVRPRIPGALTRVVWGLTSRPPVSRGGLSSGFPFARRVLPLRPPPAGFPSPGGLRFVPFGRCPVPVPPRFPSGFPSP